jgi:hypothetical protein
MKKEKKLNQAINTAKITQAGVNNSSELQNTCSTAGSISTNPKDREHIDTIEQQKKVLEDHRLKIKTLEVANHAY